MDLRIPVENFIEDVLPNTYLFHRSGCYHYFSQCSPQKEILSIYRQPIWPGIERIDFERKYTRGPRLSNGNYLLVGSIGKGRQFYPTVGLQSATKTHRTYDKRTKKFHLIRTSIRTTIHKIVATICRVKPSPDHKYVDHINGDRSDYRIENLRWTTPRENAIGVLGGRVNPDEIYDLTRSFKKEERFSGI